jgi:hypothetical protein
MELGVDKPILEPLIYFVKELKAGAAYMLNGYGTDRVVVKLDSGAYTDQDVRFLGGVMASIDPSVRPIVATPSDILEMDKWANGTMPTEDLVASAQVMKSALNMARAAGNKIVKLKALNLVILEDAAKKMGEGDKTDVRFIAAALNAPGGLEKLGQVIAADFFIGNTDRFVYPPPGCKWQGQRLKTLQNVGNVFIAIDEKQDKGRVAGLDILDPSNGHKNTSGKLKDGYEWMGELLDKSKAEKRMKFCHDVIDDLNYILGPRNRKFSFLETKRLGSQAANRLYQGMKTGCEKIQGICLPYRKAHGTLPTGLEDRFAKLNWNKR